MIADDFTATMTIARTDADALTARLIVVPAIPILWRLWVRALQASPDGPVVVQSWLYERLQHVAREVV